VRPNTVNLDGIFAVSAEDSVTPLEAARAIALEHRIPPALMAKLLQRLARSGLVASLHGTKGGYRIARPASQITLREVIERYRSFEGESLNVAMAVQVVCYELYQGALEPTGEPSAATCSPASSSS
jgi:Rrf2 family protein